MKKVVFGLILILSCQARANNILEFDSCTDKTLLVSRVLSSGSQVLAAYILPNYGIGPDIKFGLYFSAGMENPWITACLWVPIGVLGQDPVALSTAFSLFNRGMALTTLHESMGVRKWMAFGEVVLLDIILGNSFSALEKFKNTKWMGAVSNSLEHAFGPLLAGTMVAVMPLTGVGGETVSSEFSEESGIRVTPALFDWLVAPGSLEHTATSAILAASSYWVSYRLMTEKKHNLKSSWVSSAAMGFMLNALIAGTQWLHQTLNA